MKRRTINTVIILAITCLAGVIIAQYFWMQSNLTMQQNQLTLQEEQAEREARLFNDRVLVALTDVAKDIVTLSRDSADLYEVVTQVGPNYFTVRIQDTLHPYLLETILDKQFDQHKIGEDYTYGIYDCFTDSVVYGKFVAAGDNLKDTSVEAPQIPWQNDAHYFAVYFPGRYEYNAQTEVARFTPWAFSSLVILIITLFLGYALYVMLRQKRLSEVKTDFINNMTHELKTPISTISLSSEALLREGINEEPDRRRQYAKIIYDENQRLKSQVDRVLQLAKLEKDHIKLEKTSLDLHEMIEVMIESFELNVEAQGGKISAALNAKKASVIGDEVHLTNVIYNLVDNAIKYSPEKPEIVVTTRDVYKGIEVRVQDNGIGMTREQQRHIFEKFYRVPTGNVHNVKGFGLGLHYVKVIAQAHNGRVTVQSKSGEGSEFVFYLPYTP